ncbi:MAG: SusD/RagB family nutrient-binding outer membrane lipoprotein [Bacteroidales bacterium]|jgi:hypothetical protein|nr:SusD/RagB family nutrient-binding outer membrane lipoprotein [Bacteroidales bacterium]
MKKILKYFISLILITGIAVSCDNWLNVNTDPDNPNDASATVDIRLPWIQYYYMYAWGTANTRTSFIDGLMACSSGSNYYLTIWDPTQSPSTTTYQNFFLGSAVNIAPMITKAEETGAYHYIGAALTIRAMGFLMLADLYGEMPYTEALSGKYNPVYDTGETIYKGCMEDLNNAIRYFGMTQEAEAKALSEGDIWNKGDVNKWIKLCYGLKARYFLQISKKSTYNADSVLTALSKAPQSNSDNTIMRHYNVEGDATNFTVGDPYQTNSTWNSAAYGTHQRITRYFANLLNNTYTGGSGDIDPRMSKIMPAMMSNVILDDDGNIKTYEWKRDIGVDIMNSDVSDVVYAPYNAAYASSDQIIKYEIDDASKRADFVSKLQGHHSYVVENDTVKVTYRTGNFYINSTDYKRAGDTAYVNLRSNSLSTRGKSVTDMYYYADDDAGAVAGTGSFFVRPDSDSGILTYAEMCFIKAEVYMRLGNKVEAYQAYIDGIKADFDMMQAKLQEWKDDGTNNEDQMPMNEADIENYMHSGAVIQSAANLTMFDIIKQKIIALGFNMQNWNDMRRFNYSTGDIGNLGVVYVDYKRPFSFTATDKMTGTDPTALQYWMRRFAQSSHETNYNSKQVIASNKFYTPGVSEGVNIEPGIYSDPVWWDKEE